MSAARPRPTPSLPAVWRHGPGPGKRGVWTVRGTGKDGSLTVTGGPVRAVALGHAGPDCARQAAPDRHLRSRRLTTEGAPPGPRS